MSHIGRSAIRRAELFAPGVVLMLGLVQAACSETTPLLQTSQAAAGGAGASNGSSSVTSVGGSGGRGPPPPCPAEPPLHLAPCDSPVDYACSYDDCAQNNAKVEATCEVGHWWVNYSLCADHFCATYYEDVFCTEPNELCVVETLEAHCTPHPPWACPLNPCEHEPFSCSCAGVLCGPFLECVEADPLSSKVICDLPPPEPNPAVPLVSGDGGYELLLTDTHAYWAGGLGTVRRVKLIGGGMVDTFVTLASSAPHVALDPGYLYVGDSSGTLRRFSLTNNPTEEVLATGLPYLDSLAVNSQLVLWRSSFEILSIPITGGSATVFSSYNGVIALDDANAFIAGVNGLYAVPVAGGNPMLVSTELANRMALDATHVYFLQQAPNPGQGKVLKVAKTGGTVVTLASNQYDPQDIALDDTHVYFSRWDGYIVRVPKQGGQVEVFAAGQLTKDIAVNATHVYWITGCPAVMMKAK